MLKKIRFSNYKSWVRADVDCAQITGIFGTNSSGKTSIIQFPLLLKQTKDATDRAISLELNGDYLELGSIHDIINKHDMDKTIGWAIGFRLAEKLSVQDPSKRKNIAITEGDNLSLVSEVGVVNSAPEARQLSYRLGNMRFALRRSSSETRYTLKAQSIDGSSDFQFIRTKGRAWQLPGPIKSYAFPDQARTYFQNAGFLADLEAAYEAELDRIFYLGPLREFPKRDYLWARSRPSDVGLRGQKAIDAILAASTAGETRNIRAHSRLRPFQEMVAYWLKALGLVESFRVEEIAPGSNRWQAKVKTTKSATEVLLTDVGFGVSQVLPVITLLLYVPEGSTVILEQPEIHLHPLAQANLADLIIQTSISRRLQVIIESHSEHLLLRLQRRVAEEVISSEYIKLYFCDAPAGSSRIHDLELDRSPREYYKLA